VTQANPVHRLVTQPSKNWKNSIKPDPTQPNPLVNPTQGQLWCNMGWTLFGVNFFGGHDCALQAHASPYVPAFLQKNRNCNKLTIGELTFAVRVFTNTKQDLISASESFLWILCAIKY